MPDQVDPRLLSIPRLISSWASERIVQRGRQYYLDGRVLQLKIRPEEILGVVEGSDGEYQVSIRWDGQHPVPACTCPYHFEAFCKHGVALLLEAAFRSLPGLHGREQLAFSLPPTVSSDYLKQLAELERDKREARSRSEPLELLASPEGPVGRYTVHSRRSGKTYQVQLRDRGFIYPSCTCKDFLQNELGTCKHLELVRRHVELSFSQDDWNRVRAAGLRVHLYLYPRSSLEGSFEALERLRMIALHGDLTEELLRFKTTFHDTNGFFRYPEPCSARGPGAQLEHLSAYREALRALRERQGDETILIDQQVFHVLDRERERLWHQHAVELKREQVLALFTILQPLLPGVNERTFFSALQRKSNFLHFHDPKVGRRLALALSLGLRLCDLSSTTLILCPRRQSEAWHVDHAAVWQFGELASFPELGNLERQVGALTILDYHQARNQTDRLMEIGAGLAVLADPDPYWSENVLGRLKNLQNPCKVLLTEHPVFTYLEDFHGLAELLDPTLLGPLWRFLVHYSTENPKDYRSLLRNHEQFERLLARFFVGDAPEQLAVRPVQGASPEARPTSPNLVPELRELCRILAETLPNVAMGVRELNTYLSLTGLPVQLERNEAGEVRCSLPLRRKKKRPGPHGSD